MTGKSVFAFIALAVPFFNGSAAFAEEPAPPVAPTVNGRDAPDVPWTSPAGRGVAFSYDNGLWGGAFAQAMRIRIPFNARWGMVARPMMIHQSSSDSYRMDIGGRLELFGATPVYLNFARLYGGGGPQVTYAAHGVPEAKAQVGGGGQFGFEFFLGPQTSFFIEIGGTSGLQGGTAAGATAMAGMTWYPWSSAADDTPRQTAALGN